MVLNELRGVGQNVTKEEYGEHLSKIALFKKWFNKEIASTTADSNDHAVVILPIKSQNSRYERTPKSDRQRLTMK